MTYLRRRVEHFLKLLSEGKLHFASTFPQEIARGLKQELRAIRRTDDGQIDLRTVGPMVRSHSRMIYSIKDLQIEAEEAKETAQPSTPEPSNLASSQRHLFSMLDEFFSSAVGRKPTDFGSTMEFGDYIRTNADQVAHTAMTAFPVFEEQYNKYYKEHYVTAYGGKCLPGVKLVLGGGRFSDAWVESTRSTLLYADTIFVADPILPWLEAPRLEERFSLVIPLQAAFQLLQLRPLVDARLPYPAIIVFPSWEISFAQRDDVTKDGIARLFLDFMLHFVETRFDDESEAFEYAASTESEFLSVVEKKRLFWPVGGTGNESLREAIQIQRDHVETWQSDEVRARVAGISDGELVARTIFDRLAAQYHLRENAEALSSHPLLPLEVNWHYYELCAKMCEDSLTSDSHVTANTLSTVRTLNSEEFRWLGNIPIDALVELRERGENETFRRQLNEYTITLHDARVDQLERTVPEVVRAIESLLRDHRKDVDRIQDEYEQRHKTTAALGWSTLAAMFLPWLAPWVPITAPVALGSKYAWDKLQERRDARQASRSLTGILASAARRER